MSIRNINANSAEFQCGAQYRTSDGKVITLKHFCVEQTEVNDSPCIDLEGIQPGQRVRTANGDVLYFDRKTPFPSQWPYLFGQGMASYTRQGIYHSDLLPGPQDIVEILPFESEAPRVPLSNVSVGDTFRLRNGRLMVVERVKDVTPSDPAIGVAFASDGPMGGLWFLPDGQSNLYIKGEDVIEIIPAPVVSLENVPFGSTFLTRSGRKLILEKSWTRFKGEFRGCQLPGEVFGESFYAADGTSWLSKDYDAVKIVSPPKEARVSITEAVKGDKFRLRSGEVFVHNGVVSSGNRQAINPITGRSLFFEPNGICPNRDSCYEVVEVISAPRVDISKAVKGDTIVLRNGERFVLTGEVSDNGNKYANGSDGGLYFRPDGSCPAFNEAHDVVELIPAPAPSLADRVFSQVSKVDLDKIEMVVISSKDYMKEFDAVKLRIGKLGRVNLKHSQNVAHGCFQILFV